MKLTLNIILAGTCLVAGCASVSRLDSGVKKAVTSKALPDNISSNTLENAFHEREPPAHISAPLVIDLDTALELGSSYSRALQTRRENLYLSGVTTLAERRRFGPQYSGTLDFIVSRASGQNSVASSSGNIRVGQILPTGGQVNLRTGASGRDATGTNTFYDSYAGIDFRQPLLAGAGYEASRLSLLQEEQNLLYAVRAFALDRQDFAIKILRDYYDLLRRKAVVKNTVKNTEQAEFLRRRSEALFKIRKATAMDVMRSQQQELSAVNRLELVRANFDIAVKRFLMDIGIPTDTEVVISGNIPDLNPVRASVSECIVSALELRLDLRTELEKVDDAARSLRVARNAMLPALSATGSAMLRGEGEDSFPSDNTKTEIGAGLELELPLDKRAERDTIARSTIAHTRARRNAEQKREEIEVQIIESFRLLKAQEQTVHIEKKNSEIARRRADYAVLQFRSGNFSNRDVVEAQNELLNAENAYVDALSAYETRRIQLLREIGALDITADGRIVELPVSAETRGKND